VAAIVNPNPISLSIADKYWVVKCTVMQDIIVATLAPWDGTYVVGNVSTHRRIQIPDMQEISGAIFAEVAAMANIENIKCVDVEASDSLAPVKVVVVYDTGAMHEINGQIVPEMENYSIPDLFAAIEGNSQLAEAYGAVMAEIAAGAAL